MDTQVEELIDRIKRDGVAAAENSASLKISQAEKEAEKILQDARNKADSILNQAKEDAEKFKKAGEDAIKQAGRNLLISFRDSVTKELSSLVTDEIEKVYSPEMLQKLIPEVVKEWAKNSSVNELSVLLNSNQLSDVESGLKSLLKTEIEKGLVLKIDDSVVSGFRIGVKNGSAFYDYSAEAVAELFCAYLNPKVSALMKEAAR